MNNIGITNSHINFNGLIVKGTVSGENVKKLGDFASKIENINFTKDLEKNFEVDAVLNNEITPMIIRITNKSIAEYIEGEEDITNYLS